MAVIKNNIKFYRQKKRLTQREVLEQLAKWRFDNHEPNPVVTTYVGLSKLENNHNQPSPTNQKALVEILGVDKKRLFTYGELPSDISPHGRPRKEHYKPLN